MANFFECDDITINLDHVVTVARIHDPKKGASIYTFRDVNDEKLGHFVDYNHISMSDLTDPVVAASPGAFAYLVWIEKSERPSIENTIVEKRQIIAWRISRHSPTPVFSYPDSYDEIVFIPQPDGSVQDQLGDSYDNIDCAVEAQVTLQQNSWDKGHKTIGA